MCFFIALFFKIFAFFWEIDYTMSVNENRYHLERDLTMLLKKHMKWLALCLILMVLSVSVGLNTLSLWQYASWTEAQKLVFWQVRIPRTLSIVIAGATLSVSGLIMQQLTQNKFVSPSVAGTTASARLGILFVLVLLPNATLWVRSGVAFLFAFLGTLLFLMLVKYLPQSNPILVPLVGMMYGNVINAFVTFFAYQLDLIQTMNAWLQGNFSMVIKGNYELLYAAIPVMIGIFMYAHHFSVAGLGKDLATSVGLRYVRLQMIGVAMIGFMSSILLISVGSFPFIGVVIPNLVSLRSGDFLKTTVLDTALWGSMFLLICDIISRLIIAPYEIPVSVTVGVIGSILFLYLIRREYGS